MTNDIEGKVRILKEILKQFSNEPLNKPYIDALKTAILSLTTKVDKKIKLKDLGDTVYRLRDFIRIFGDKVEIKDLEDFELEIPATTKKPLDIEKIINHHPPPSRVNKHYLSGYYDCKDRIIEILSHFSKPVIKYPEKLPLNPNSTHCSQCGRDFYAFNNGYNKAISEMKRLNGEGGV